jgi:D-alanyl-D-alanine carboxypeptidase/D-alanyl-D-alanine-endopeptidase (penicillin-binding protein 4)
VDGRRHRAALVAVLGTALALLVAALGLVIVRPWPVGAWLADAPASSGGTADATESPPAPVLAGMASDAPAPTAAGVAAAIGPLLEQAGLGGRVSVSVVDVLTGERLYGSAVDQLTTPASTAKLVTAATVLEAVGPVERIPTRVVAGANPGEVVLVGGGDPTLAVDATGTYPGAARLDRLAAQVKAALGGAVPTRVIVDSSLFTGGVYGPLWDADIPTGGYGGPITALMTDGGRVNPKAKVGKRFASPDLAAGQAFARELGLPKTAVVGGKAPATPDGAHAASAGPGGASPTTNSVNPGTELGRVESPPILRLVEMMLSDSDNVVAESLARQVALARGEPASYAGAAAAMHAVLTDLGLPAPHSALFDGSGLSRGDKLTASLLSDLLALAASGGHPRLSGLFGGLPVAGWSGTLKGRYHADSGSQTGAGVVRAKTGTLSGVNAISGMVVTAEGRLLTFAILADQVPVGQLKAQSALDRIAATLAACGCR